MSVNIGTNLITQMARSGIIALLATTAACGGPKPGGQTVAVVDGSPVTEAELSVEMGPDANTRDKAKRNKALDLVITRKIVAAAAKEQGVDKDPVFQLQLAKIKELALIRRFFETNAMSAGTSISDSDINNFLVENPQIGEGRKLIELDAIQFALPTEPAVLAGIKGTTTLAGLTEFLRSHNIKVESAKSKLDTASMSSAMYKQLMDTRSGEPLMMTEGLNARAVVVTSSTDQPSVDEVSTKIARRVLQQEEVTKRAVQQTQALRASAKVEYASGYAAPSKKANPSTPK